VVEQKTLSPKFAPLIERVPRGRGILSRTLRSLNRSDYIWDPWILPDDDCYRLFYLRSPKPTPTVPWWSQGKLYGAISKDFQRWESIGVVLEPEPSLDWASGRMLAGSTYKENGVYYLFHSAAGKGEAALSDEKVALATSTDGLHWQRYTDRPLISDFDRSQLYGDYRLHYHWRDPYLVKDPQTGKYCLFISAFHQESVAEHRYLACIAIAVADEITGPYKLLPAVTAPTHAHPQGWWFAEMERPQIIYRHGKYHLFFSCWPWHVNPYWREKLEGTRITPCSLYWFVSDQLTGPYEPANDIPIVSGSEKSGIYGTNFFTLNDELIAIGWAYRLHVLQITPTFRVEWSGDRPEIRRIGGWL
jgi:beta-fructofuranosidase